MNIRREIWNYDGCYLKVKKELNQKIDKIQEKYERLLTITTEDGELMKEIQVVKQEAEQAEVFDKMTRHIAETFIDPRLSLLFGIKYH